MKEKIISYKR